MFKLVQDRYAACVYLICILGALPTSAAENRAALCYSGNFSAETEVRWMRLIIPEGRESPKLWFGEWGLPITTFYSTLSCEDVGDGSLRCKQDTCEGDYVSATLLPTQNGDIVLEATGVGADLDIMSTIQAREGKRYQYGLFGDYFLRRQDPASCEGWSETPSKAMDTLKLQPGDVGEVVHMIEDALSKLGYFASPPDDIYTDETARSVSSFQKAAAMPETGTTDSATWKRLSLAVVVGEGGRC